MVPPGDGRITRSMPLHNREKKATLLSGFFWFLEEAEGFEPSMEF